jgi:hypothetical protein
MAQGVSGGKDADGRGACNCGREVDEVDEAVAGAARSCRRRWWVVGGMAGGAAGSFLLERALLAHTAGAQRPPTLKRRTRRDWRSAKSSRRPGSPPLTGGEGARGCRGRAQAGAGGRRGALLLRCPRRMYGACTAR